MSQEQADSASCDDTPSRGVVPNILSPDGAKHVEWIKTVFRATVKYMMKADDNKEDIIHCSLKMNEGVIYLSSGSSFPEQQQQSILAAGGQPRGYLNHLNVASVADANEIWKRAMENDAREIVPLREQSWKALYGTFRDPLGYEWAVCACIEEAKD